MEDGTAPEAASPPGKLRTWWHPLLVRLLEWLLRDSCEVRSEVNVGQMPLRLDILLIRRLESSIPAAAMRDLNAICRRLNAYTLIEFKAPTDALAFGDWNKLLGCAHLFVAQAEEPIRCSDLTLMVLAPALTAGFTRELSFGPWQAVEEEPGIHRITGGEFSAFLVETDRVAGLREPVLTFFSHEFLEDPGGMAKELRIEHAEMLLYVIQQIVQLRGSPLQFEVQRMGEKHYPTLKELQAWLLNAVSTEERLQGIPPEQRLQGIPPEQWLQGIPPEQRLQGIPAEERLQGIPAEQRLRGIPPEQRLQGIPPEQRLHGLSEQERALLRKLLDEEASAK